MKKATDNATQRRNEILSHALNLVRESGLASLTMKKVAERVGFSETAAYRYFPTKQALMVGLAEEIGSRLLGPARSIAESEVPPEKRLERIVRHQVDFVLELDGLPILLLAEAAATGEAGLLATLGVVVQEFLRLTAGIIDEMRPYDDSLDGGDLALLVMGIPAVLAIHRRIGVDPALENRARNRLVPFLVRCLAHEHGEVEQ